MGTSRLVSFSIGSHYRRFYSVRPHWAGSSMRRPVDFRSPEGRMPQPQGPGQGFSRREPFGVGGGARGEIARGGDHIPGVVDPEGESYVPRPPGGRQREWRPPQSLDGGNPKGRRPGPWEDGVGEASFRQRWGVTAENRQLSPATDQRKKSKKLPRCPPRHRSISSRCDARDCYGLGHSLRKQVQQVPYVLFS